MYPGLFIKQSVQVPYSAVLVIPGILCCMDRRNLFSHYDTCCNFGTLVHYWSLLGVALEWVVIFGKLLKKWVMISYLGINVGHEDFLVQFPTWMLQGIFKHYTNHPSTNIWLVSFSYYGLVWIVWHLTYKIGKNIRIEQKKMALHLSKISTKSDISKWENECNGGARFFPTGV